MRSSTLNLWVTLDNKVENQSVTEMWHTLNPPGVWASIQPLSPSDDGRSLHHAVTIRFHPEVGVDTRMTYVDPQGRTRYLFVQGIQDIGLQNVELRCVCDEVIA